MQTGVYFLFWLAWLHLSFIFLLWSCGRFGPGEISLVMKSHYRRTSEDRLVRRHCKPTAPVATTLPRLDYLPHPTCTPRCSPSPDSLRSTDLGTPTPDEATAVFPEGRLTRLEQAVGGQLGPVFWLAHRLVLMQWPGTFGSFYAFDASIIHHFQLAGHNACAGNTPQEPLRGVTLARAGHPAGCLSTSLL